MEDQFKVENAQEWTHDGSIMLTRHFEMKDVL